MHVDFCYIAFCNSYFTWFFLFTYSSHRFHIGFTCLLLVVCISVEIFAESVVENSFK